MAHLVDKDRIIAEIQKRVKKYATIDVGDSKELNALYGAKCYALESILSFLDALEVKEVDLEKEYKDFVEEDPVYNKLVNSIVGKAIAKHFFELGLNTQEGE